MIVQSRPRKHARNETRDLTHPILAMLNTVSCVRVMRNNVGLAQMASGGALRYGLGTGSSDIVGIVTMPDGVGRFFALEVKWSDQRPTQDQERWLGMVRSFGGFGAVVHSPEEAIEAVKRCRIGGDR